MRRLELGASVAEVARACEVNPNVLHRWERELRGYGAKAFTGNGKMRAEESRVAELERKVGRQAMEVDFFAAMLAACRGAAKTAGINYPRLVTLSDSGQTHPGKRKMKAVPIQPVTAAVTFLRSNDASLMETRLKKQEFASVHLELNFRYIDATRVDGEFRQIIHKRIVGTTTDHELGHVLSNSLEFNQQCR